MQVPKTTWELISLAGELGFIIAIPLLLFSQLGKFLDAQWGTKPLFIILGIVLALLASGVWLYQHLKPYLK